MTDQEYMEIAVTLAAKAKGFTSPNPLVGAVVVRDDTIVGSGWHKGPGLPHAEVNAIDDAGDKARGGTIYVTLEPCNHHGRTPPCTRKIINAGICRVVVATEDPNPYVSGGGIAFLKDHGIQVDVGICRNAAERLMEDFIWYVKNNKHPFVVLKCASTLDGRLATSTGDSQWITGEKSRQYVHELRQACDGILIGSGTLIADDPSLTVRLNSRKKKDPRRIILDSELSIDLNAKVLNLESDSDTIIATSPGAPSEKKEILEGMGATVLVIPKKQYPGKGPMLDLENLMEQLGAMGMMSVLIEGGGSVIGSALSAGIVNKICFFIAPKILGGDDGIPVCRGRGPEKMADALLLKDVEILQFEKDVLFQGYLKI